MTNEEALNDFRRRYEGTFVWLSMDDLKEETLVYVNRVESNESKIGVLHLTSEKFGTLTINLGSDGHSLQFRYPPVGVFQHKGDALVFYRRPSRQYRRGICSDNSSMLDVTRYITGRTPQWTASEVQAAFSHNVSTVSEALATLTKKTVRSVALKGNMAISKSMIAGVNDHIVWHWTSPIAFVHPERGTINKVLEPMYTKLLTGVFNASK